MGLFGLGLAWRIGAEEFGLPQGLAEVLLGAVSALYVFSLLAYLAKLLRRPKVLVEDLRILPGRAGLSTMVLCLYLLSSVAVIYSIEAGLWIMYAGLAAHVGLLAVLVPILLLGPAEQRRVTPVWHLHFVGFILATLTAQELGLETLGVSIFVVTILIAFLLWSISLDQLIKVTVPAPLRPLLMIHVAPAAILGIAAARYDLLILAYVFAAVAGIMLFAFLGKLRWLIEAGISPLWGAFTFPLAATSVLWLELSGGWRIPGALLLVASTLIIPPIAAWIMREWARGSLATKTNAATA